MTLWAFESHDTYHGRRRAGFMESDEFAEYMSGVAQTEDVCVVATPLRTRHEQLRAQVRIPLIEIPPGIIAGWIREAYDRQLGCVSGGSAFILPDIAYCWPFGALPMETVDQHGERTGHHTFTREISRPYSECSACHEMCRLSIEESPRRKS